jgi:hypothetical protein
MLDDYLLRIVALVLCNLKKHLCYALGVRTETVRWNFFSFHSSYISEYHFPTEVDISCKHSEYILLNKLV